MHCFYFIVKINLIWCLTDTVPVLTYPYHGSRCGYAFGQSFDL